MAKKAFLSHSSKDKEIVKKILDAVPTDRVWVDQYELEKGDPLPTALGEHIDQTALFILLFTSNANKTRWVEFEINMALTRHIEEENYKIIVVRLDHTPLPRALSPFLRIDKPDDVDAGVRELVSELNNPKFWEHDRPGRLASNFVNRFNEKKVIEEYVNYEVPIIVIQGQFGIGKTAFIQDAIRTLLRRSPVTILLTASYSAKRLALEVSAKAGVGLPAPGNTEEEDINHAIFSVENIHATGRALFLDDTERLIDEDGNFPSFIISFLEKVSRFENLKVPLFIATTRRIGTPPSLASMIRKLDIRELDSQDAAFIIRRATLDITQGKVDISPERLLGVARRIYGYPLAAVLASELVAAVPLEQLERDLSKFTKINVDIAHYILGRARIKFREGSTRILEILSLSETGLTIGEIRAALGDVDKKGFEEEFNAAINELAEHLFISHGVDGISMLPIVRDTYFRQASQGHRFIEYAERMALYLTSAIQGEEVSPGEAANFRVRGYQFSILSGNMKAARKLEYQLEEELRGAAERLHYAGRYEESLSLGKLWLEIRPNDYEARYIFARNLTRLNRTNDARREFDVLLNNGFRSYKVQHGLGLLNKHENNIPKAIEHFERALIDRPNYIPSMRDLADCYDLDGDSDKAGALIGRAYELNRSDRYVLPKYVDLLRKKGDLPRALELAEDAVRTFPDEAQFRHSLSLLFSEMNRAEDAYREEAEAYKLRPGRAEIALRFAKLETDNGRFSEADAILQRIEKNSLSVAGRRVLSTITANRKLKNHDFSGARSALNDVRIHDSHSISLIAKISLAEADAQIKRQEHKAARNSLMAGLSAIQEWESRNRIVPLVDSVRRNLQARLNSLP